MGPHRSVTDFRSYLTETVYDAESGGFRQAPVPHPFAIGARTLDVKSRLLAVAREALAARVAAARRNHLGYPYNLVSSDPEHATLSGVLLNNLGDPYVGSHFGCDTCALEREAIAWLMDLWEVEDAEAYWGAVGASGTEGNLWALYLGREALPEARLIHSADAHYSIPKAARILRMEATAVASRPDGTMDLDALSAALAARQRAPVVLALTCGTTMKGAHDDIPGAIARLDAAGIGPGERFVHVDGALDAMVVPFLPDAPEAIRPSFRHGVDSISTSGHKMIGTPMPCGVLVARRSHVRRVASAIAYLRSDDTTLMGSRSGHVALAIWERLVGRGRADWEADARASLARARRLEADLVALGVPVLRNPHALTVVFPKPEERIVRTYQLPCDGDLAHAIVMPSVTDALLDRFVADCAAELNKARRARAAGATERDPIETARCFNGRAPAPAEVAPVS